MPEECGGKIGREDNRIPGIQAGASASIAEGGSSEEISEALMVGVSTIKGHNRRIFEKLGVKQRTEAVASATEMGLL